jgi:hypothetical protein
MAFPVTVKLLGTPTHYKPIQTKTANVSHEGLLLEVKILIHQGALYVRFGDESVQLVPFLILNEKLLELEMALPAAGDPMRASGRVIWCNFGSLGASYFFRMGVVLQDMGVATKKKWEQFVRDASEIGSSEL